MSSTSQPAKSSRWGMSFLEKAVNSVESRLDTILADGEETPPKPTSNEDTSTPQSAAAPPAASAAPTHVRANSISRSSSNARTNDRLQERLARAMVNKQAGAARNASPASSAALQSRTASPLPTEEESRTSLDSAADGRDPTVPLSPRKSESGRSAPLSPRTSEDLRRSSLDIHRPNIPEAISINPPSQQASVKGSPISSPIRSSFDSTRVGYSGLGNEAKDQKIDESAQDDSLSAREYEAAMAKLHEEHEAAELRWQEELHGYVERIDALQSKLQYLTKEAADSAKKSASSAPSGSAEKKLLEKDERIALLMEEGQNLSKAELKHMTLIKKLRAQVAENTKAQAEAKKRAEKAEKDYVLANEKARRAEAAEKRAVESLDTMSKAGRDSEALVNERNALNATVADMKAQLARAVARAEAAEAKAQTNSLEIEKRHAQELKDDLASAKIERELSEEKLRREIRDLKEANEREKERARALEVELRGEQSVLETKMETLRSRAEEVSSSATGDAQAKLLRQIETLQTQYAVASENWQGIEGSLLARLANVEKERDEIARREGDLRKKGREVNLKARRAESDLDNAKETMQDLERTIASQETQIQKLSKKLEQTEKDLASAKEDFSKQKEAWETVVTQRIEEERTKLLSNRHAPRVDSPIASTRKSSVLDTLPHLTRQPSHNSIESLIERPGGSARRPSANPFHSPEMGTPVRQNSGHSLSLMNGHNSGSHHGATPSILSPLEAPSINMTDASDDGSFFPHHGADTAAGSITNDLHSLSTVAAGPSVQLVERMSATVRRLASERSASKDELARLTAQRDEARREVVSLMREAEEKRTLEAKVAELEKEVAGLDSRYLAALEMAGEKSEEVEELKNDVLDLKKIYRELVESTLT